MTSIHSAGTTVPPPTSDHTHFLESEWVWSGKSTNYKHVDHLQLCTALLSIHCKYVCQREFVLERGEPPPWLLWREPHWAGHSWSQSCYCCSVCVTTITWRHFCTNMTCCSLFSCLYTHRNLRYATNACDVWLYDISDDIIDQNFHQ